MITELVKFTFLLLFLIINALKKASSQIPVIKICVIISTINCITFGWIGWVEIAPSLACLVNPVPKKDSIRILRKKKIRYPPKKKNKIPIPKPVLILMNTNKRGSLFF